MNLPPCGNENDVFAGRMTGHFGYAVICGSFCGGGLTACFFDFYSFRFLPSVAAKEFSTFRLTA
jgi:hypothetical protein